jgi:hypothetical protein
VPVLRRQLLFESLELALGRPHDVLSLARLQEVEILFRDHPAIDRPDALGPPVAGLHRLDDLFQGGRVVPVSREHFVA